MAPTVFYSQCICRNLKANLRLNPERDSLHSKLFRSLCVFPSNTLSIKMGFRLSESQRSRSAPSSGGGTERTIEPKSISFHCVEINLIIVCMRWKSLMERDATEMFLILNKLVEHILHIQHIFYTIKI